MSKKYSSSEVADLVRTARMDARVKQIERSAAIMQQYKDKIATLEMEIAELRRTSSDVVDIKESTLLEAPHDGTA